jgi:nitrogen fixation protein NifB
MPAGIMLALAHNHPCFCAESKGHFGRIHLPVASHCNIHCAYCRRDHDCLHENKPGVTKGGISPEEALERLEKVLIEMPYITVAGIAGPGDAFCKPEQACKYLSISGERG